MMDTFDFSDKTTRRETDAAMREQAASSIEALFEKVNQLKTAADEEGEEDMIFELERIDERMRRTSDALRGADYSGVAFFENGDVSDENLAKIHAYDNELLKDIQLLTRDVLALKYETIGNLTLREVEGTIGAIELKVTNRKDSLMHHGSDDA